MDIAIVCGKYHEKEVSEMLAYAQDEAGKLGMTVKSVQWVSGAMEVPLSVQRLIVNHEAVACLGIIEKGETGHGAVLGQAVVSALIDLQLKHNKRVGLGIIGPGAEPKHIPQRLEPHARAAISCLRD